MRSLVVLGLLIGCKEPVGSTVPSGPRPDTPEQGNPVIPDWIEDEMAGNENACDTNPFWDSANISTTYFSGVYNLESSTDSVFGYEFMRINPNPNFAATGYERCTVVWEVFGTVVDPFNSGNYGIEMTGVVDEDATDCVPNDAGVEIYVGFETLDLAYDVIEFEDGSGRLLFESGNPFTDTIRFDGDIISYVSDRNCQVY